MIDAGTLALFLLAVLALFLSPGPNMAFVLSHGVAHGARGGLAAAVGIALADVVHTLCAATGVTALIAAWPPSFELLRYAGAAYLLWLAWQALRPRGDVGVDVGVGVDVDVNVDVARGVGVGAGAGAGTGTGTGIGLARGAGVPVRPEDDEADVGFAIATDRAAPSTAKSATGSGRIARSALLNNLINPKALLFFMLFLPQFVDAARGAVAAQLLLLGAVLALAGLAFHALLGAISGGVGAWLARRPGAARARRLLLAAAMLGLALRLLLLDRPAAASSSLSLPLPLPTSRGA